jgi:flagellar hook-associated protein 1 FlgK
MGGLNATLNMAQQTLANTQLEIATTSNNISNANTTGYAVETAVQTSNPSILTSSGWLGTGATVTQITEARDRFIEQQLMNATTSDSQYTSLSSELTSIQSLCSDSGDTGISSALGTFFDAWSTLEQDTSTLSNQTSVYSAATGLASAVKTTYNELEQVATGTNGITSQIQDTVDQANKLIDQIAQINTAIAQTSTSTNKANDLQDEAYTALDSLSKLIPVSFSQDSSGMFTVDTTDSTGSVTIVSGGTATPISTSSTITGGQLGGLLTAQTDLNGYIGQFNDFASTLISQVNYVTDPTGKDTALDVFSGTDASSITASTTFLSGMSSSELSTCSQAMSALQDTQVTFPDESTSTLEDYLSNIQDTVGNDVSEASANQSFYDSLKTELQTQQESVSGVSVDAELVNTIQEQQIYEAAAKVVTTCDTLMTTAINMVQP